ncbi:hypothetical protein AVEN_75432-1 [Araneus ventricosus]|uniref:Uncharacterized protein n=1 Tax=Araneus ventricosus TaxID=182803 RepID=A0A4Y2VYN4_ARAVE|nr:hypothetical protein AVEN_75432-1 [Araneus ventricosus]
MQKQTLTTLSANAAIPILEYLVACISSCVTRDAFLLPDRMRSFMSARTTVTEISNLNVVVLDNLWQNPNCATVHDGIILTVRHSMMAES